MRSFWNIVNLLSDVNVVGYMVYIKDLLYVRLHTHIGTDPAVTHFFLWIAIIFMWI